MLGAICGDILGSTYEFEEKKYYDLDAINLCLESDDFTDDSALTFAVADWLLNDINKNYHNDEELKLALGKQFLKYSKHTFKENEGKLGFGRSYFQWCAKADLIQEFKPYNSYGNGSGMRVSPVGWFFDTMEETLRFAKLSADVTHNHPEGQKGAMCIAAAIFLARKGKTKNEIKEYLLKTFEYDLLNKSVSEHRDICSWSEICQDTVPMAVVAFLESENYETAIKNAISYGSDSDTIADMAGAIAEAYYKEIPGYIYNFCISRIPSNQQKLIKEFYTNITKKDV
ncbi:MAG: ADP-ribosylglycohydrolase family protein [Clostridia bacterium]|nr:ADP-ribosylglycohydrolase family protein [Clostridia bacterium]